MKDFLLGGIVQLSLHQTSTKTHHALNIKLSMILFIISQESLSHSNTKSIFALHKQKSLYWGMQAKITAQPPPPSWVGTFNKTMNNTFVCLFPSAQYYQVLFILLFLTIMVHKSFDG